MTSAEIHLPGLASVSLLGPGSVIVLCDRDSRRRRLPGRLLCAKDRGQKNRARNYDAHNCTQRARNLDHVKLHWTTIVGDARCL